MQYSTTVARRRPSVTLYVRCLSCYMIWFTQLTKQVNAFDVWIYVQLKNANFLRNSFGIKAIQRMSKSKKTTNIHQTQYFFIKDLIASYTFRLVLSFPQDIQDCINTKFTNMYVILWISFNNNTYVIVRDAIRAGRQVPSRNLQSCHSLRQSCRSAWTKIVWAANFNKSRWKLGDPSGCAV